MSQQPSNQREHLRELATRSGIPLYTRLARMYYGRARALEYLFGNILILWFSALLVVVVYLPYNICGRQFACALYLSPVFIFAFLLLAMLAWVMTCQRIRRFHDLGLAGWIALATSPAVPLLLLLWMMRDTLPAFGNPFREPFDSWREVFFGMRLWLLLAAGLLFVIPGLIAGRRKANRFDFVQK